MPISLNGITDQELASRLIQTARSEREKSHEIVLLLSEMSKRRLYAELGYPSMFDYACKVLKYSRSSAQRRIVAARIIAKFPEVYDCLIDGRLTLAVLELVADALDRPNARELLCELRGKTIAEAQVIVAYHLPIEPRKLADRIEPVFSSSQKAAVASGQLELLSDENSSYSRTGVTTNQVENHSTENEEARQHRFSFTADASLKAKVERACELLGTNDLETVMTKALDEYLARHCPMERIKRRRAKDERRLLRQGARILSAVESVQSVADDVVAAMPESEKDPAQARFPSLKLRDEILERDGYQCTYVAPDGTRCCARRNLEIDHIKPHAHFGQTVASNLRVACSTHNHLLARQWYGDYYIDQILSERKPDDCGRPTVPPPTGAYDTQVHELLFGEFNASGA